MFNLVKLLMKSGTFKFAFSRSFGTTRGNPPTASTTSQTVTNPTLASGQIAVYFVTFYTNFGTISGSYGNTIYCPEGNATASGLDIQFTLINSVRISYPGNNTNNQDSSLVPMATQGVFTSSSAYSGSSFTFTTSSYSSNNTGFGPCHHATLTCFVYTPFN